MAKVKDRRAAHKFVAELLWEAVHKAPKVSFTPELKTELERIREAHFAAGTVQDGLPDDFELTVPGSLAHGGIRRCQKCGVELKEEGRLCLNCGPKPSGPKLALAKKNGRAA